MLSGRTRAAAALTLRGESARQFVVGSLLYSARPADELSDLASRAMVWYRNLVRLGLVIPFGVVLDVGYLMLDGEAFRLRGFFEAPDADPRAAAVREVYETRVLVRRLQAACLPRLRRIILDNEAPDLAISRVLEILLRPVAGRLSRPLRIEELPALPPNLQPADFVLARDEFEQAIDDPGLLLELLSEIADQSDAFDLDQQLHAEDFYELRHIRIFPRESLREVARRIKTVERVLGDVPRWTADELRELAMADTTLESVGTYPTGGIAELTVSGPLENLVPSELIYLEPDEPIDPFLVRFAEGSLLKYLRDSAVHRRLRRSVGFVIEDCLEFNVPVTAGADLLGTKVIRCLMGLVLALVADLLTVFKKDDVDFTFCLLANPGEGLETAAERREILEVLHLLFREKEEQGQVEVREARSDALRLLADWPRLADRHQTIVVFGRPETVQHLARRRGTPKVLPVAVDLAGTARTGDLLALDLSHTPARRLEALRTRLLEGLMV